MTTRYTKNDLDPFYEKSMGYNWLQNNLFIKIPLSLSLVKKYFQANLENHIASFDLWDFLRNLPKWLHLIRVETEANKWNLKKKTVK